MSIRFFLITIILYYISFKAFSQGEFRPLSFDQAGEIRTIYQQNIIFNEKYTSSFDGGTYIGIGVNVWTRLGFRGSIKRTYNHNVAADIGMMYNHTKFENRLAQELRPHQTFHYIYPRLKSSSIQHRLRLEQRLFFVDNIENREFSARLRYRAYNKGRFNGKPVSPKAFYYCLSLEWNFNIYNELEGKVFLRGRYGVGYGYQFNSKFSLDASYLLQHDASQESHNHSVLHIFHISFRHKIRL